MRVYDCGKPVPIEQVTWELLCKYTTYVDHDQDKEQKWPVSVVSGMRGAACRGLIALGVKLSDIDRVNQTLKDAIK